jgi:hypothetical protein
MAQFFDKLEHHVEGVMRFLVYFIFICGIVATIFYAYNSSVHVTHDYYSGDFDEPIRSFDTAGFIAKLVVGVLASWLSWVLLMFNVRIGINIKRIKEHLDAEYEDVE